MMPDSLFSVLSDPTRLRALMLIQSEGEVCVCELTHALQDSQPKISPEEQKLPHVIFLIRLLKKMLPQILCNNFVRNNKNKYRLIRLIRQNQHGIIGILPQVYQKES